MDPQGVEGVGKHARHDDAILERVTDTGRRLRAGADDPPLAVSAAREIERHQVEEDAVGRADAMARAQKARMPEHERGRQQAFAQQRCAP